MKLIKYLRHTVLLTAALPCAACLDATGTCEDRLTCPNGDDAGGEGGGSESGGSAGKAGGGGTAGNAGKGGSSGQGGTSAEGGAAGTAGEAGVGGESLGSGGSAGSGDAGSAGAGAGEGGGTGGGETPCDATNTPLEDACVVDEDYGVFVSPSGDDDSGDGSRDNPYETLGKATEAAAASDKRVYACATSGGYDESLSLGTEASGLEFFGGFSCDDWSYRESNQSGVTSSAPLALRIEGVSGLRIEGFEFVAADATAAGGSSIGALLVDSDDIVFRRVRIEAGSGVDGANAIREDFDFPLQSELEGNSATGSSQEIGGAVKSFACPDGTTTVGGEGGDSEVISLAQDGQTGLPDHPGTGGEGGDSTLSCGMGGTGLDGANAPTTLSAPGAASNGALTATGWMPASGMTGANGLPGQGGGGGRGSATKGGGGGGAGSCGGAGGPGGMGGGASIALAIFESGVTLESIELIAHDGGNGGNGAPGQAAQTESGFGGNGGGQGACPGGNGGIGAAGGAAGGGAGGLSVGVLWSGTIAPVLSDPIVTLGSAGMKGLGGDPGVNDGIDGVAGEVLEVP
jgi:hypothetical protein